MQALRKAGVDLSATGVLGLRSIVLQCMPKRRPSMRGMQDGFYPSPFTQGGRGRKGGDVNLYEEGLERIREREERLRKLTQQRKEAHAEGLPVATLDDEIRWQKKRIKDLYRSLDMVTPG